MSRSNQEQRKILAFARRHGDAAACDAYEVSGRTLRRWRKQARTRGEAFLGDCRGGRSGRRSGRKADPRQVEFIRAFRADRLHLNAGKQAVKPALDAFSRECGLPPLSVSTIGRLIADAPDGMRASPRIDLDRRGRVKPRQRRRNHEHRLPKRMSVRNPGDLVALDTVEIRPVGGGARLFLLTAVDHHSRLAFDMAFPKRNAQCAAEFLRRLLLVLPVPVLALLSDNGAEFQADFDRLADRLGLRRFFIFPSCPKQNGRNERFNRTLRYGFVQANEHFADDLHAFNRQLAAWLIWYNAQKPHRALDGNTPLNFLHSQLKNGQLLWTPTQICISCEKIIQSINYLSRTQMPTNNMNLDPHGKARASEPALEGIRVFVAVFVAQLLTFAPGAQAQIQIPSRPLLGRRNACEDKADGLDEGNCKVAISTYTHNFHLNLIVPSENFIFQRKIFHKIRSSGARN